MNQRPNSRQRKLQVLIVCLAVFALLFMATESTLAHHHAAAVAHAKTATVVKLPSLIPVAHGVRCEVRTPELELLASDHSSRAPPSA